VRKINKLGRRAAALVLAVGLTLSTAAPVLAADADEVQTPAAQTEQQETDTEADEADVDTEADEAAALPELSEDREVAEEDEAAALPELSEDREVAEEDEAAALPELSEDREAAGADEDWAADEAALLKGHKHSWKKEKTVAPTCTEQGYTLYKCAYNLFGVGCTATKKDDFVPALDHNMSDWIVVAATCTTAGEKYKVCQRSGCNHKVVEEGYAEAHPALDHDFEGAEWVIEAPTCTTPGQRYQVCKRDGCNQKNIDEAYAEAHPALGHVWGKYVDDDKPGCQQQTETAHCTREGCTATDTEDRANFGPGGNPLPHKYTTYKGLDEILGVPTKYKSTCDYGCGTTKEFGALDKDVVVDKTTQGAMDTVKVDDMTADERANQIIDDALKAAQEAVKQAKTKKEAIAALDQISATVKSELSSMKISVGKLNKDVSIDPKDLENILKPLDTTIDSLKGSLDDSFLSQETITSLVNKLATDVPASTAPETGIKKLIYNTVYDAIYNLTAKDDEKKTTDSMPDVKNMVLQLVSDVAKSDEGWNTMTDALVDDAVELALDEVMKDKTYAMLLKTKLGASTVEEVRAEVKKQLVNDPTFMNSVRAQVQKAADEASKGVSQGWSDQKVLDRLQANLLPISGLVANKIDELGSSAGNIADNKVDDTVHKFLPGKLGDWVSDKVGNKVNNIVQNKVNDLGGQVTDLIDSFIKQFTCGKHEYGDFEILKNPTCTEKGQKGKICKKCGKITEKTDIDAAGHTPVTDPAVAPTETSDGLTEGSHCGVCGAVLTAQEVIPMRDPTIDTWFSRAATTEADAKAAGFDSVDAANAALDAALTAAGFDPANAEHFTVQVNSSIGVLPNDRFSESGVTGKLTLPEGTRGKTAQTYYAVQMFTADTRFHKAGDVVVTPVSIDTYAKTGLQFTVYSEAVMAIAWKAQ
jgi:hypothetical protein